MLYYIHTLLYIKATPNSQHLSILYIFILYAYYTYVLYYI